MYNTLAKLPIVVYEEISSSGNINLLLNEGETETEENLAELWQKLSLDFSDKSISSESKKVFRLTKDIEAYKLKHKIISVMCECLKFDWDNELVGIIRSYGYILTQANYYDDIEKILRESEALLFKATNLETMLPKSSGEESGTTIYDVLASYSAILSLDFDFEAISCLKYISLQKQVASKIKASEQQPQTNKTKNRR